MSNWLIRLGSVLVALSIFALWQVVTQAGLVQPIFLPSPLATIANLWRGLTHGDLLTLALTTMERMFYGWMLASLGGIVLGRALEHGGLRHGRLARHLQELRGNGVVFQQGLHLRQFLSGVVLVTARQIVIRQDKMPLRRFGVGAHVRF